LWFFSKESRMAQARSPNPTKFQMSPRDAFVLVLAVVTGVAAGFLLRAAGVSVAQAVLGGVGTTALALKFFDGIIK
jgi:hypothetical protein